MLTVEVNVIFTVVEFFYGINECQQRRVKINQGKRMLENWRIEKIQKITAGSSSSEATNHSSPKLAGKT